MRERLFVQCLYCFGNASSVAIVALPLPYSLAILSKRVGAREHPPCSSSPRRRGSILVAKCRMMMDSRLRGNDGWRCGNDCLLSACIVWVMSGVFGWCQSWLRSAEIGGVVDGVYGT